MAQEASNNNHNQSYDNAGFSFNNNENVYDADGQSLHSFSSGYQVPLSPRLSASYGSYIESRNQLINDAMLAEAMQVKVNLTSCGLTLTPALLQANLNNVSATQAQLLLNHMNRQNDSLDDDHKTELDEVKGPNSLISSNDSDQASVLDVSNNNQTPLSAQVNDQNDLHNDDCKADNGDFNESDSLISNNNNHHALDTNSLKLNQHQPDTRDRQSLDSTNNNHDNGSQLSGSIISLLPHPSKKSNDLSIKTAKLSKGWYVPSAILAIGGLATVIVMVVLGAISNGGWSWSLLIAVSFNWESGMLYGYTGLGLGLLWTCVTGFVDNHRRKKGTEPLQKHYTPVPQEPGDHNGPDNAISAQQPIIVNKQINDPTLNSKEFLADREGDCIRITETQKAFFQTILDTHIRYLIQHHGVSFLDLTDDINSLKAGNDIWSCEMTHSIGILMFDNLGNDGWGQCYQCFQMKPNKQWKSFAKNAYPADRAKCVESPDFARCLLDIFDKKKSDYQEWAKKCQTINPHPLSLDDFSKAMKNQPIFKNENWLNDNKLKSIYQSLPENMLKNADNIIQDIYPNGKLVSFDKIQQSKILLAVAKSCKMTFIRIAARERITLPLNNDHPELGGSSGAGLKTFIENVKKNEDYGNGYLGTEIFYKLIMENSVFCQWIESIDEKIMKDNRHTFNQALLAKFKKHNDSTNQEIETAIKNDLRTVVDKKKYSIDKLSQSVALKFFAIHVLKYKENTWIKNLTENLQSEQKKIAETKQRNSHAQQQEKALSFIKSTANLIAEDDKLEYDLGIDKLDLDDGDDCKSVKTVVQSRAHHLVTILIKKDAEDFVTLMINQKSGNILSVNPSLYPSIDDNVTVNPFILSVLFETGALIATNKLKVDYQGDNCQITVKTDTNGIPLSIRQHIIQLGQSIGSHYEYNPNKYVRYHVDFTNDNSYDAGGVTRAFFNQLTKSLVDSPYFIGQLGNALPKTRSVDTIDKDERDLFFALGQLMMGFYRLNANGGLIRGGSQWNKSLSLGRFFDPIMLEAIFKFTGSDVDVYSEKLSEWNPLRLKFYKKMASSETTELLNLLTGDQAPTNKEQLQRIWMAMEKQDKTKYGDVDSYIIDTEKMKNQWLQVVKAVLVRGPQMQGLAHHFLALLHIAKGMMSICPPGFNFRTSLKVDWEAFVNKKPMDVYDAICGKLSRRDVANMFTKTYHYNNQNESNYLTYLKNYILDKQKLSEKALPFVTEALTGQRAIAPGLKLWVKIENQDTTFFPHTCGGLSICKTKLDNKEYLSDKQKNYTEQQRFDCHFAMFVQDCENGVYEDFNRS